MQLISECLVGSRLRRHAVAKAFLVGALLATQVGVAQVGLQPQAEVPKLPSWARVTEKTAFSPRDTAEDVVFGGKMWLSNGYVAGGKLVRDLWSSSDGAAWELVSDDTPYDGYSEMVVYEGKIWAVKGSVWNSSDGVHWNQVSQKTPFGARGYGELAVFRGRMWQLGSGNDLWSTADGVEWECARANAPFGPRYGSAATVFGDMLWLMGGATTEASDPPEKHYPKYTTHNDVWCSSDGAKWTQVLEHAPWAERMWFVAKVYAGKLWISGGFSNRKSVNFAEVWWTEDGKNWQEYKSALLFSPRHEVTPYVFNGSLWVVGGNMWPLMNDVWRLSLPEGKESGKP
jgi:hypothetical protein